MKKVIKLIAVALISILVLNMKIFAASGNLSVSSTSVNVGESFTISVKLRDVAAWEVHTNATGPVTGCVIEEIYDSGTGYNVNEKVVTANCKATDVGTITITLSGNITSEEADNYVTLSGTKTVTVKKISSNNDLKSLKVNNSAVSNFNPSTTTYILSIDNENALIAAEPADSSASVTGTGIKKLKYGKNQYDIKVTAENGNIKIYTIIINRNDNRDTNNFLSSLTVDKGTLTFNKNTTSYKVNVDTDIDKITINATPESQTASIDPNSIGLKNLKLGDNKFEIKVTAENGNIKTYVITVNRKDNRDTNNFLSSLTVDKGTLTFDKNTTSYNINIEYEVEKINISATAESQKAKVTGDGEKTLKVGNNKFEIKVTAENETTKIYTITVIRADKDSSSQLIKYLTIDGVLIDFSPSVYEYNINIQNQSTLNFNYELEEGVLATLEGNQNLDNNSVIVLKLEKGDVKKEYTFNVHKEELSSNTIMPVSKEDKGSGMWIIVGAIGFVLIGGIMTIFNKKKGKNKVPVTPTPNISQANFNQNQNQVQDNKFDNIEKF